MNMVSAKDLFRLFEQPLDQIGQVMWSSNLPPLKEGFCRSWGGNEPILVFEFISGNSLLVAEYDNALQILLVDDDNNLPSTIEKFARKLDVEGLLSIEDADEILGIFYLDTAVCPDPGWRPELSITKACVVSNAREDTILGFCIWVNLGIRIGTFVPPIHGVTLCFNDSCDEILSQAMAAQKSGLVTLDTTAYPGRETLKQMSTIDWFDWLRPGFGSTRIEDIRPPKQ